MLNFIGHKNWEKALPIDDEILKLFRGYQDSSKVLVLRSILFFHAEQTTTMARIKANFTDEAISKLIHDNFIKII